MSLTQGPVHKRLAELWLPMIGGIFMVKAIGLADAYFVGQLGEDPLAAISFTFPVTMTLTSLAIGLSAAASSVLSRAIGGAADQPAQQAIVTGSVFVALLIAATLATAGFLGIESLLAIMGASGNILASATSYMKIWFAGAFFLIVPITINGLLRSTGDSISPAILLTVIAALNIALNPVFIFGFGPAPQLGMQGAAVATVIARALSMFAALWIIRRKDLLSFSLRRLKAGLGHWRELVRIGAPAALSTSLNPIALSIATAAVATLGSAQVAAFGVATKLQTMAVVPLLALSSASAPIVGQNSSAGELERSRRALWLCAMLSLLWALFIAAVIALTNTYWVGFFGESQSIRDYLLMYLAIVPFSYVGYGIIVSLSAALNGLGRSFLALSISGGRAMLLLAPAAWLGVILGGFMGLAIATAICNLIAGIVGLLIIWRHSLTTHESGNKTNIDMGECE